MRGDRSGKLDGEASINNHKGKLIFFYEWKRQTKLDKVSLCGTRTGLTAVD